MSPSRTVSYYRQMEEVVVTVKSGRLKFFTPTIASTRRLRRVLDTLNRERRLGMGFTSIYGGGVHVWIDPAWLRRRSDGNKG